MDVSGYFFPVLDTDVVFPNAMMGHIPLHVFGRGFHDVIQNGQFVFHGWLFVCQVVRERHTFILGYQSFGFCADTDKFLHSYMLTLTEHPDLVSEGFCTTYASIELFKHNRAVSVIIQETAGGVRPLTDYRSCPFKILCVIDPNVVPTTPLAEIFI